MCGFKAATSGDNNSKQGFGWTRHNSNYLQNNGLEGPVSGKNAKPLYKYRMNQNYKLYVYTHYAKYINQLNYRFIHRSQWCYRQGVYDCWY